MNGRQSLSRAAGEKVAAHVDDPRDASSGPPGIGRPRGARTTSIGVGALDRPDAGWRVSDPGSLFDLRPVHEPDRYIAAGVMPEKVALAVAVEVAGFSDRPHGGDVSEGRSLSDLRAVHQPDGYIAAVIMPQNVALAIAVEVLGADDGPRGGYVCRN